jgi:hypothetical protein
MENKTSIDVETILLGGMESFCSFSFLRWTRVELKAKLKKKKKKKKKEKILSVDSHSCL